ncbi:calcium uptake protein, mitochondrial-like [Impatiens glandulifera]|uniref:calcium uptake protein, mitochondrial-like n=1 Tax=Impatiens glandulifera TaxID=253017 RepID=UPI001FB13699|nr:calcium uptake protein, mitochondrial-like [Impatiens glandulifera]
MNCKMLLLTSSMRRVSNSIPVRQALRSRLLSSQSWLQSQEHCWDNQNRSNFETGLRSDSLTTILVVLSGMGLYQYSNSDSSICFADSDGEAAPVAKKKSGFLIFGDDYRRKVFFKYEKRIRTMSPPEKVFEYFASIKSPGKEVMMNGADLMRAIIPVFPPWESDCIRVGSLKGEAVGSTLHCAPSEFFMLFDTNNDGLISFPEYIFFVTLLSIPESCFSVAFKMFDLDNNGEIDREEFKKVMSFMRTHNRQGGKHRDGLRIGLNVSSAVENGGLLENFFGKDGNTCLKHDKFVEFLRDLHEEILRLEFAHYDFKSRGTISAIDFAFSMVASADIGDIDMFVARVRELHDDPRLASVRFTFEEFKSLAELRKKLQQLSLAIFAHGKLNGLLTKQDFQRAAFQVCEITLSENVVDMIYFVFDVNKDGNLSSEEFVRVLQKRERDGSLPWET